MNTYFLNHFLHTAEIRIFGYLVSQYGDEYIVAYIEKKHDLYEVEDSCKTTKGIECEYKVLIDTILEIVKEVFKVAELDSLEFLGCSQHQHVEQYKRSYEQNDVEVDNQVGWDGLFEEKAKHESVFGFGKIDYDFGPCEETDHPILITHKTHQSQYSYYYFENEVKPYFLQFFRYRQLVLLLFFFFLGNNAPY